MIATWVQMRSTRSITWLDSTTVPPFAAKSSRMPRIVRAETGSTASNGSSRTSSRGAWTSGAGQGDLLGHPGRVVDDQLVAGVGEAQGDQQLLGALGDELAVHPAQQARIGHQLSTGQAVEQPEPVGQHPDPRLGSDRVGPDVDTQDLRRPFVGAEQAGGHGQRGGLACTVRTHEAEERPPRHVEVEVVDGHHRSETLGEAPKAQRDLVVRHVSTLAVRRRTHGLVRGRRAERCRPPRSPALRPPVEASLRAERSSGLELRALPTGEVVDLGGR